jgi:hypothetical protein
MDQHGLIIHLVAPLRQVTGQLASAGGMVFAGDCLDMISGMNSCLPESLFAFFLSQKNEPKNPKAPKPPTNRSLLAVKNVDSQYPQSADPTSANMGTI